MAQRNMNARFVQKHDKEVNWEQASNFYPLKGELIIYDPDENYDYPRFKVGEWDGKEESKSDELLVYNLPFATADQVVEFGKGLNSIVSTGANNQAISEASVAIGKDATAGAKGYYIQAIDFTSTTLVDTEEKITPTVYLAVTKPETPLYKNDETDTIGETVVFDDTFETPAYEENDEVTIIAKGKRGSDGVVKFHYHFVAKITKIENNKIVLDKELPFTTLEADSGKWYSSLLVSRKPTVGAVELMMGQTALGEDTIAAGENSLAEGYGTLAAGAYAHAEGRGTVAVYGAHAEGASTKALAMCSHTEGTGSKATGNYSHAEGYETEAASIAHAEGNSTRAQGTCSHAEGDRTEATEVSAHAEGTSTHATGKHSHAEGEATTASGSRSHAEGQATQAKAQASHSEGYNTTASGVAAHAEGHTTTASNEGAHAEGRETKASGAQAHAEGHTTEASGNQSHAEGAHTKALNSYSHASGYYTKTSAAAQTVVGQYNADDAAALFIVGNGTADEIASRKNAFVVKANGTAYAGGKKVLVEGDVVPGSGGTLNPAGSENKPIYIDADGKAQAIKNISIGSYEESGEFIARGEDAKLILDDGTKSYYPTCLSAKEWHLTGSADADGIYNFAGLNENGLNFNGNVSTYLGHAQATYGRSGFEFYPAAYSSENGLWGPTLSYDSTTNELKMRSHKDWKHDLPAKITLDNGQTKTILTPDSITIGNITLTAETLKKLLNLVNTMSYNNTVVETDA